MNTEFKTRLAIVGTGSTVIVGAVCVVVGIFVDEQMGHHRAGSIMFFSGVVLSYGTAVAVLMGLCVLSLLSWVLAPLKEQDVTENPKSGTESGLYE